MKSNFTCALAFTISVMFLILFIPLLLIYSHLEELNAESSLRIRKSDEKDDPLSSADSNDWDSSNETDKFTIDRPCPQFEFWCESTVDRVICIESKLRCDSIRDCPNGEDETDCVDVSVILETHYRTANDRLSSRAPEDHVSKFQLLETDKPQSTDSPMVENATQSLQTTVADANRHPGHPADCTLFQLASGTCNPCNFSHNFSVVCRNLTITRIPKDLTEAIKVLNLDYNEIEDLDGINSYHQIKVVSVRYNKLTSVNENAFYGMPHITRIYLSYNQIREIHPTAFTGLHNLKRLYLSTNRIQTLEFSPLLRHTPLLMLLDLSYNRLTTLNPFPSLKQLEWLDLEHNALTDLSCSGGSPFAKLSGVKMLSLKHNRLTHINSGCFTSNSEIRELDLSFNSVEFIHPEAFTGLTCLSKLALEENSIKELPINLFWPLASLRSLNLSGAQINNIHPKMFSFEGNLTHLYFSRFRYCMYAPHVRSCRPFSDGLSSIHHLLVHPILRKSVWAVALFTCVGNLLVIIWRSISSKEDQVLSLFVQNLSVSDFLMGVYLLTIASYDYVYEDRYAFYALEWTRSWQCSFCGVLAMISSELSVLVLTLITVERYKCITAEFRVVTTSSAKLNLLLTWFISICLAVFPLIYWKGEPYYGSSSGLCFPLHINEPYNLGWQYSAFVIIGINLTAVIVIAILYWKMFSTIKSDRKFARPALSGENKKREDAILALRFFAIVSTDCLCWLPLATIKLIAFTSLTISPTLHAWLVVFILPINSALNPVIYTLAAPTELHHRLYKQCRRFLWSFKESLLSSARETLDESGESNKVVSNEPLSRSPSLCTTTTTNGAHNSSHIVSQNVTIDFAAALSPDEALNQTNTTAKVNASCGIVTQVLTSNRTIKRCSKYSPALSSDSSCRAKDKMMKYKLPIAKCSKNQSTDHSASQSLQDELFPKCNRNARKQSDATCPIEASNCTLSSNQSFAEGHPFIEPASSESSRDFEQRVYSDKIESRRPSIAKSPLTCDENNSLEQSVEFASTNDEETFNIRRNQLLKLSKLHHPRVEEKDDIERLHDNVTSSPSVIKSYSANTIGKVLHVLKNKNKKCNKQLDKLISVQSDDSTDSDKISNDCNSSLLTKRKCLRSAIASNAVELASSHGCVNRIRNNSIAVTSSKLIHDESKRYNRQSSGNAVNLKRSIDSASDNYHRNCPSDRSVASSLLRSTYSFLLPSTSVSSQESQLSNESIFPANCNLAFVNGHNETDSSI